ncbi:MAG: hypothetical protein H0U22_12775 [Geodermatophilaceae bacterium]|nr:hypothetical protein [Geodermatophilaceae bacterium]
MLAGLSPQRRRLVVGILVVAMAAAVVGVFFAVRAAVPSAAVRQDQPGPVLMVPGLGGSTGGLDVLARRLEAGGRDVTVISLPGDGTGDLQAQALDQAVDAALARTGAASVVVGYSAGGIVTRSGSPTSVALTLPGGS